eukprot:632657-Alexandrium_andersonii.AAC.1
MLPTGHGHAPVFHCPGLEPGAREINAHLPEAHCKTGPPPPRRSTLRKLPGSRRAVRNKRPLARSGGFAARCEINAHVCDRKAPCLSAKR